MGEQGKGGGETRRDGTGAYVRIRGACLFVLVLR